MQVLYGLKRLLQNGLVALCVLSFYGCDNEQAKNIRNYISQKITPKDDETIVRELMKQQKEIINVLDEIKQNYAKMKEKYDKMGFDVSSTFFGAQNGTRCNNLDGYENRKFNNLEKIIYDTGEGLQNLGYLGVAYGINGLIDDIMNKDKFIVDDIDDRIKVVNASVIEVNNLLAEQKKAIQSVEKYLDLCQIQKD